MIGLLWHGLPLTHIMWDWNGTLLDDAAVCVSCMNQLLDRRGMPLLTAARYRAIFDFPIEGYYQRVGFDFSRESFRELGAEFIERYEQEKNDCSLRPGARGLIQYVQDCGVGQSVLSAYRQDLLIEMLQHHRLDERFMDVRGVDDIYAAGKVARGMGWISDLGVDPATVLLIGDTTHDFEVAQAMGTHCALIEGGNHDRDHLERCGVPVYEDLLELRAVMQEERCD